MNRTDIQHAPAFRFRRFCRAKWAAFNSMHREVTIGRLSARTADSSLAKTVATAAVALVMAQGMAVAQSEPVDDELTLPEVQVLLQADTLFGSSEPAAVLSAADFKQYTIHSIADLVALLPGVDLRMRGVGDAQADLSMRGGTFDQMVVLLGGVNLTDPQTGHHTLDLPLDLSMVQRIELLSPSQLMARGIVAFCGGVNIVVSDEYRDQLLVEASGGSFGTANVGVLATHVAGPWALTAAAAYHRSDGYIPNTDYRHGSLLLQALRHSAYDDLQLQIGGQLKAFGSQAFYSTTYPDQYEATRTATASAHHVHRFDHWRMENTLYGRLHRDRFELFREGIATPPAWYSGHNHHLSSLVGVRSRAVVPMGQGELLAGADLRREGIRSNVLGETDNSLDAPFTRQASRIGASLFAGYSRTVGRLHAEGVALGHLNSQFGANYGLSADASYRASEHSQFNLSLARTYRLPTFTDLYYQGANQQANPNLNAESSLCAELGYRYTHTHLWLNTTAYYRHGSQIIDWVRRPNEELWYSMNHTAIDAIGLDASATWRTESLAIRADYSYCYTMHDAGSWISGAAIDYLHHKMQIEATYSPIRPLHLTATLNYRQREGQWIDANNQAHPYGSALLIEAKAEYDLARVTLYIEGRNLLGTSYRDYGGVPMPKRSLMAGMRLSLQEK